MYEHMPTNSDSMAECAGPCVWTSCDERLSLTTAYNASTAELKLSASALSERFRDHVIFAEQDDLARAVDVALAKARKARRELDQHRARHGC